MTNNFEFNTNLAAKTIHVTREFNAPTEKLWKAWTEPDLIVKWIAPKPWTAETKIWDFAVGGIWLYAMVSPEGQKHWTNVEFTAIETGTSFSSTGMFSDEDGTTAPDGPKSHRVTKFLPLAGNRSKIDMLITFDDEATIKMFVEMGFKTGTEMSLANLDELLAGE